MAVLTDYVFLGVPNMGQIVASAMPGLIAPSLNVPVSCAFDASTSALCRNFNVLMKTARDQPERPKYFAMHHADVSAAPGWLDVLIAELERVDADIISSVIAIKDGRGLTSTGLLDPSCEKLKRFTMQHVQKLPETFTAESAGYPGHTLLINTGLWVGRTDRPWFERTFFRFEDDVDEKGNPYLRSEDWLWSEDLRDYGTKVYATRKVPVLHWGLTAYGNTNPWGAVKEDGWASWRRGATRNPSELQRKEEFRSFGDEPFPLGK